MTEAAGYFTPFSEGYFETSNSSLGLGRVTLLPLSESFLESLFTKGGD
jgi:hypothetical protein